MRWHVHPQIRREASPALAFLGRLTEGYDLGRLVFINLTMIGFWRRLTQPQRYADAACDGPNAAGQFFINAAVRQRPTWGKTFATFDGPITLRNFGDLVVFIIAHELGHYVHLTGQTGWPDSEPTADRFAADALSRYVSETGGEA